MGVLQPGHFRFVNRVVSLLGAPFSYGQPKPGAELGVSALRRAGIVPSLEELRWHVDDLGDLEFEGPADNDNFGILKRPRCVGNANRRVKEMVYNACRKDNFVLTLGGDHSIATGTVAGHKLARPDLCVVWVDAHADINTVESTPSGNIHGMPISWLFGLNKQKVPGYEWVPEKPLLSFGDLVYIGLRDVDAGEKELLRKHHIHSFSMTEIDRYGIGTVVEKALDQVNPYRNRPIHISLDVDACDPSVVSATGTMVRGGLSFREAHYLCEALGETGLVAGMDLVEINPMLGDDQSADAAAKIGLSMVRSVLGDTLL